MILVPLEAVRAELRVSNSRFIACLSPADSVAAAREFIASVKTEFPDATHHVPAFAIGGGNAVTEFCSDDGEPSGTAGRPLLSVIKGSGFGNVAIVVVRYFGGTLLGTGGLVRAYQDAGKAALAAARGAILRPTATLALSPPYAMFERAKSLAAGLGARIVSERFGEAVEMELEIPEEALERFSAGLSDLSSGSLSATVLSTRMSPWPS